MNAFAVLLAAGAGERFGGDKILAPLRGKPVWRWSFEALLSHPRIDGVGIVGSAANLGAIRALAPEAAFVIEGGASRQASCGLGVAKAPDSALFVLVHDAARPLLSRDVIDRCMQGAERAGAAAAGVPNGDTLRRRSDGGWLLVDRADVWRMQTPQVARRELLLQAFLAAERDYTDEMEMIAANGAAFEVTLGDVRLMKITTPEDLEAVERLAGAGEVRTGWGYDVHRFSSDPNRPLWLGGVKFEGHIGLEGHSDADALLHAVVDSLLGAAALGDIGRHFPNTDPQWHDVASIVFLRRASELVRQVGFEIVNVDMTVIGEAPKVGPKADDIRKTVAAEIGIEVDRVSLKATTNEGMGFIGRREGIAATAVATIRR